MLAARVFWPGRIGSGKKKIRVRLWLAVTVVCALLWGAAVVSAVVFDNKSESMEDIGVSTGEKNQSLVFDDQREILYVGTHSGALAAFEQNKEVWKQKNSGAYSKLVLDAAGERLYAANENNHVYVHDIVSGELLMDINVQRKVVGVAVSSTTSHIAVITNTGSSKANLIIYSPEGEELENKAYKASLRGVEYCDDGETLMLADKRGDVSRITEDGDILNVFSAGYEVNQLRRNGDSWWIVCRNDTYYELNEDLQAVRSGKINNTINAKITSIGVDDEGEYVLIGTSEGYVFVMDERDRQIYVADLEVEITDLSAAPGGVYITGYGDFVVQAHGSNLANLELYKILAVWMRYLALGFGALSFVSAVVMIPRARRAAAKLLKRIWAGRMAYLMLLPTFTLLYFFSYRGILTAMIRAFTDWSVTNDTMAEMDFVGLDNFRTMITEGYFTMGLRNLLLIMITSIIKTLTMPLAVAWMLFSVKGDRRKYFHRFLFVFPIVVPGVVGAMIWQKIYDPTIGLLNQVLGAIGLENLQRVWLGNERTAIWSVVFMGFPFVGALAMLVYYGGLLNVGNDVIESALIDGGTRWNIFWKIQLPLIRPQISVMMTLTVLGAMQEFNSIYILTSGGPGTATYVPALELYLNAAQYGRYGYASALGVVLLIFTMTFTLLSNRLTRERE